MSAKTITKSVRLTPEESEELAQLSEKARLTESALARLTESALMKQWIRDGIHSKKLELAIKAYMERKVDLRGGAAMADGSYNRFLREVQARNIVILEEDGFLERLAFLAESFDDEDLQSAIKDTLRGE